jgi:hypothetical protein
VKAFVLTAVAAVIGVCLYGWSLTQAGAAESQCRMTVDQAAVHMQRSGIEFQVIDDPELVAAHVSAIKAAFGADETGAKRVVVGNASDHIKIGFEDVDGCLTVNPYYVPKPKATNA